MELHKSPSVWITTRLGRRTLQLLDLDHPRTEAAILGEIESGVDVYYDRRWEVTEAFCRFLIDHPAWVTHRSVLILGAGIGMETVVIGGMGKKIYLNDLAPIALDLCARQLRKNGINNFELIPGPYEAIDCPPVDIVVGCFLVYSSQTAEAMRRFLERCSAPVLLMNEPMSSFQTLIRTTQRKIRHLLPEQTFSCILVQ